jgi:hypothetical protein
MSTLATEVVKVTALAEAVASVAKRLRIQDFDVVGIGASWSHVKQAPVVRVHVSERTHALAVYFDLRDLTETEGTAMYAAERVTGLPGIYVGVYGPASPVTA